MENLSSKKISQCCLLAFSILFSANSIFAQDMEVTDATTPPLTPENLITNIFLGEGVEVLDVTYEGDPIAVGYFKDGEQEVGIERGIIMTSGRASSTNCNGPFGANCLGNNFASSPNNSNAADADLTSIASGNLNDVAKFTITFIPTADTLRFKYVFASEEYPEWACSAYNDVFGFFIHGPGITGPFQNNAKNIALIPGTNTPVSINNIHPQNGPGCNPTFAQFYNNNDFMPLQPVYDGYLDVFIAEAIVIPCETYTIKLSVADVGDDAYDTGVFLEAKSFGTGSLKVETATVSLDGTMAEGCSNGTISFSLPNPAESDFPLDYTILGTATNGVDYIQIPTGLFIPQGDSSITVNIVALEDGIAENLESIGIDIQRDICNRDTFWIFIRDNEILPPDLGPDTTVCLLDSIRLDGTLPIPLPDPPTFTNSQDMDFDETVPLYSPILVAGVQPVTLGPGVIKSVCVNIQHKFVDDLDIYLLSPGGQFIALSTDNGSNCDNYNNVCFTPDATQPINFVYPWPTCSAGGEPAFSNGTFLPEGVWSDLWDGNFPTNGTWQLLIIDDSPGFDGTLLDWTITFEPLYKIDYQWEPTDGLSCADCPDPMASPQQTTTYTLTASDSYGCTVSDSITIEVKDILPAPDVLCSNVTPSTITFDWSNVPGAASYQVSINGGPFVNPNNGQLSHLISGLTLEDTITIAVFAISDCNGEIGTATCSTPACDAPQISVDAVQGVDCPGDSNGLLTLSASGGNGGPYTYQLGSVSNATGVFTGLAAGTYQALAFDNLNCGNSIQVVIGQPDPILLQEVVVNPISCNGQDDGSLTVSVEGGVHPYTFNWNGNQGDSIAINLGPGLQTVVVTDANGCSSSLDFTLDAPDPLLLNTQADSAKCFGTNTGIVLALASGGTEPFQFQWDAAANNATTDLVENLAAGTYTVVVTDLNGCQATALAQVNEPAELILSVTGNDLFCASSPTGDATAIANGGVPGYSFAWSNGAQTATITNLGAGGYSVTVTDLKGCTAEDSVIISSPVPIEVFLTATDALCFGGTSGVVTADYTGGTSPYGFLWSNGAGSANLFGVVAGTYCLTVSDAQGCTGSSCIDVLQPDELVLSTNLTNAGCSGGSQGMIDLSVNGGTAPFNYQWSNGQFIEDITGLEAGDYEVTVGDANNCTATIAATIQETPPIDITFQPVDASCFGGNNGSVEATVTGGAGNFTFAWTGPNGYTSTSQNPDDFPAGTFTLVVQDQTGCTAQESLDISQPASAVSVSISPPGEICFGATNGTASATASGGTAPYSFAWSNGQTTSTAAALAAGSYTLTVTDGNGCEVTATMTIEQQGELSIVLAQTPAACNNGSDGMASIENVFQGTTPLPLPGLEITWSTGNQNTPNIDGLSGGQSYAVTVTNDLGCTATGSIQIGNPAAVQAAIQSTTDVSCAAGRDGTATVSASGGNDPYTYLWGSNATSQTTATATGLAAGNFTVTITDATGCTAAATATLNEPPALDIRFENTKASCYGLADGKTTAIPSGGSPGYTLNWSTGDNGAILDNLSAGSYQVTLTDSKGCTMAATTEIEQPGALTATYSVEPVSCFGYQDGRIQIVPTGGALPYRYRLNGGAPTASSTLIALPPDIYQVTISDNNGCQFEINDIEVQEPPALILDLGPDTIVDYGTDLEINPTLLNPVIPVSYFWYSNNPQTPPLDNAAGIGAFYVESPTSVTLTVTDQNGCTAEDLINIFVTKFRSVEVPTGFAPGLGGSSLNDALHVHGNSKLVKSIRLFRVFDRWGGILYEAGNFDINDTSVGWDGTFKGKEMPAGVYGWYLEVDYVDNTVEAYKGNTTLIR
ncbi:MAG: choice-of-anchor L domain-containing protein [Saprospiraceae bacterium]